MRPLVCVSPNPAIDRIALAPGASVGGAVRAVELLETPGGKGAHVAMVSAALGHLATLVLPLGGHAGDRYAALARSEGLELVSVVIADETRGTYTVVDAVGAVVEVREPSPSLTALELEAFAALVGSAVAAADVVVTSGSLPVGLPSSFHADVLAASRPGAFTVLDTGGDALVAALATRPSLVKPNLAEAAGYSGVAVPTAEPLEHLVRLVRDLQEGGARNAWVSLGERGSLLGMEDGVVWHLPAPFASAAVNAVGCGDALAGGLVAAILDGQSLLEAAVQGVAAAASKVRHLHSGRVDPAQVADARSSIEPRRLA